MMDRKVFLGTLLGVLLGAGILLYGWWVWSQAVKPSHSERLERLLRCENERQIYGAALSEACRETAK